MKLVRLAGIEPNTLSPATSRFQLPFVAQICYMVPELHLTHEHHSSAPQHQAT